MQKYEKSDEYWKGTKINTCAHILIKDGIAKAIPAYKKRTIDKVLDSEKFIYHKSHNKEM